MYDDVSGSDGLEDVIWCCCRHCLCVARWRPFERKSRTAGAAPKSNDISVFWRHSWNNLDYFLFDGTILIFNNCREKLLSPLSKMNSRGTKRLLSELNDFQASAGSKGHLTHLGPSSDESLLEWTALLRGPAETPYAGRSNLFLLYGRY